MRLSLLLISALLVSPATLLASPINYTVNGTFQSGGTLAGNVTIDSTNGALTGTLQTFQYGQTFNFVSVGTLIQFSPSLFFAQFFDSYIDEFNLDVPGYITAFAGGSVCTTSAPCSGFSSDTVINNGAAAGRVDGLASGTLVAATPEPSSLALLGTGMLAAFGTIKRRMKIA